MISGISRNRVAAAALTVLFAGLCLADNTDDISGFASPFAGKAGDPVSTSIGELWFEMPLLELGGPLPLSFRLLYANRLEKFLVSRMDPFPDDGFTHNLLANLVPEDGGQTVRVFYFGGNELRFDREPDGSHTLVRDEVEFRLVEGTDHWYLMDPARESILTFEKRVIATRDAGLLERIQDRNGNALHFTWTVDGWDVLLDRVEDGVGRSLTFTWWNPSEIWKYPHPETVTDQTGRTIRFEYDADDLAFTVHLASVTDARGKKSTFRYHGDTENNVLDRVTRPRGNAPYTQVWEKVDNGLPVPNRPWRVAKQIDAFGNETSFSYQEGDPLSVTTITDPFGNTYRHTHFDNRELREWEDEAGKSATFAYDDDGRRRGSTDRLGDDVATTFHAESGRIASFTDAAGSATAFDYVAQEQEFTNPDDGEKFSFTFYRIRSVQRPDGTGEEQAWDSRGNRVGWKDPNGGEWTMTRDTMGNLLELTNPEGGTLTYVWNADGTLASRTDSDSGVTTWEHDGAKRVTRVVSPTGEDVRIAYDAGDLVVETTDSRGGKTTYEYDDNGNLVRTTAPGGRTTEFVRDAMDRIVVRRDALGNETGITRDSRGAPSTATPRAGGATSYLTDARGRPTAIEDELGGRWRMDYDDESVLSGVTTPLDHSTRFETDRNGRRTAVVDPLGNRHEFTYDSLGRMTTSTDGAGRTLAASYDASGAVSEVTLPVAGRTRYERNTLGQATTIEDPRGNRWTLGYTEWGRLASVDDPLGNQWRFARDSRARIHTATWPDATTTTYVHDGTDRITEAAHPGGLVLHYRYDDLGHLLSADGISFAYDTRGDLIRTRAGGVDFDATFGDGRQLESLSYGGRAVVTYTYDARGQVARVGDDLSGAWVEFDHDADARPTGIRRSNGVDTAIEYDAANRPTRITDGALADQVYTLNAVGEPVARELTLPLAPAAVSATEEGEFTFDAACRVSSPEFTYDARGRRLAAPGSTFTYDGANRLVSVTASGRTADLAYDGMGNLVSRAEGGETKEYLHSHSLGLPSVVAERTGADFDRFYVYSPDGRLLYAVDPATGAPKFFHFDSTGSTLFLTDGAGAATDSFEYDAYGNVVGRSGTDPQPFTWIGRLGIREEPVGGLFHMRMRVYDPGTAAFLTPDPEWPGPDTRGVNPYGYANQSPFVHVDPWGMGLLDLVFEVAIDQAGEWVFGKGLGAASASLKAAGGTLAAGAFAWYKNVKSGLAYRENGTAGVVKENADLHRYLLGPYIEWIQDSQLTDTIDRINEANQWTEYYDKKATETYQDLTKVYLQTAENYGQLLELEKEKLRRIEQERKEMAEEHLRRTVEMLRGTTGRETERAQTPDLPGWAQDLFPIEVPAMRPDFTPIGPPGPPGGAMFRRTPRK